MAAELGQTIGKPWEISEESTNVGFGGLAPNDLAYDRKLPIQQDGSTIAGGETVIQASVQVRFLLE